MSELTALLSQLRDVSGKLCKAAEGVKATDITKDNNDSLEDVITKLQGLASDLGGNSSAAVQGYDELMSQSLAKFVELSNKIGAEVQQMGQLVLEAFQAQREFVVTASECKKPAQAVFVQLLQPTSTKIGAIQSLRESQPRSAPFFNHLSTVSEGIPALGWVTEEPKPAPFVKEMANAGQFYSNRVLKDFKEKDATHVEWARTFMKIFSELEEYVRKYHITGLSWNKQGKDASPAKAAAPAPPPPGAGPPPPPPPPAVEPPSGSAPAKPAGDEDRSALFAAINKGEGITTGLKKVTDDMKTHKNPSLRQQAPVQSSKQVLSGPKPYKGPTGFKAAPKAAAAATKKPPKFELEGGKKWIVEYQEGNQNIVIDNTDKRQTVYIFKCNNSVIQVKGKVNAITVDNCKKVGIVFESVVASLDIVNSQSIKAQVTDVTPIVNIDKTDGAMVYLSQNSIKAQIVTAKSSEMNVLVPQEDGDFKEFAVPEQYITTYDGKRLVTTMSESLG